MNKIYQIVSIFLISCHSFNNIPVNETFKPDTYALFESKEKEYEFVKEMSQHLSDIKFPLYFSFIDKKNDHTLKVLNILEEKDSEWEFICPTDSEYTESTKGVKLKFYKKKFSHLLILQNSTPILDRSNMYEIPKAVICPVMGLKRESTMTKNPKYIQKQKNKILKKLDPFYNLRPTHGVTISFLDKDNKLKKFEVISFFTKGYSTPIYIKIREIEEQKEKARDSFHYLKCNANPRINSKIINKMFEKTSIKTKKIKISLLKRGFLVSGINHTTPPLGTHLTSKSARKRRSKMLNLKNQMIKDILLSRN